MYDLVTQENICVCACAIQSKAVLLPVLPRQKARRDLAECAVDQDHRLGLEFRGNAEVPSWGCADAELLDRFGAQCKPPRGPHWAPVTVTWKKATPGWHGPKAWPVGSFQRKGKKCHHTSRLCHPPFDHPERGGCLLLLLSHSFPPHFPRQNFLINLSRSFNIATPISN